ncbi:gephyrin-like molybdotransferase Glp [Paenibacillus septentrionalis]|uniref:Molybdopterin molybdenumtransferase n=1 Tax=Paenibacillus septentrionalis TaxID=429342 RepID=A0ABW1V8T3_9BACL
MTQIETMQALTAHEAANCLCSLIDPQQSSRRVGLHEASGRVLAEDFTTPFPMPPFRRAAMDGYVVRSLDIAEACPTHPVTLSVVGEIKAGSGLALHEHFNERKSARIYTGAPVPEYWDTLIVQEAIPQEQRKLHPGSIQLHKAFRQGEHIAEAGEDIAAGAVVLARGKVLSAKEIAILASFGQANVSVYKKPRVAVIPVGDELLSPGNPLTPYHIYDANSHMTVARLQELGASVQHFSPVADRVDAIADALILAMSQSDLIITIGGVSVGDYDFVAKAAEAIGSVPLFRKVLMRPGKPTSAFSVDHRLIISLSGNPSACFAGLELLVKPTILKAAGCVDYENRFLQGTLAAEINKSSPVTRFVRSIACWQGDRLFVEPLSRDRSGNIAAFAHANALAVIPPGARGAVKGEMVSLLPLAGF